MRKPIEIVDEPETEADIIRNPGASLWIVKGRLYIQKRFNVQEEYVMEESNRTFNVAASTPECAVEAFLRNAAKWCNPCELVASVEVESVKWLAWVDVAIKVHS